MRQHKLFVCFLLHLSCTSLYTVGHVEGISITNPISYLLNLCCHDQTGMDNFQSINPSNLR